MTEKHSFKDAFLYDLHFNKYGEFDSSDLINVELNDSFHFFVMRFLV